jgi:tetratricopeptide (TPR) repeat protein
LRFAVVAFLSVVFATAAFPAENLQKAEELYKTAKYAEAETNLRGVISKEPTNARARYLLGMSLLEQGKIDQSEAELRKAAEGAQAADQIKVGLARVQIERKQMDKALPLLDEAVSANPKNADAYYYRGVVRANRQDFKGAAADLDKVLEFTPNHAKAHYYDGLSYHRLGRPDKMVEHFQIFLKLAPNAPEAERVRSLLRSVRQ